MKIGIIIAEVNFPVGSLSTRIRMLAKGFIANNVAVKIFVVAPPPTKSNIENSADFVIFAHKTVLQKTKTRLYLYYRIIGAIKLYFFLKDNKEIDFVIMIRPNIIIGFILLFLCARNKTKFFFDKGDENARLIDNKARTIIGYLAKLNQILFDNFIIPKVNVLFVVSSYLENKYKQKYPLLKIKRCLPTLVDYKEFLELQNTDIFEINQKEINVFNSRKVKMFYAGSCKRNNGLFFFLESVTEIVKKGINDFEIIFIFVDGDVNKIKNKCIQLNIIQFVTFLDPVFPKYMPAIYKYIDILILPEQGTIIANAGFPGKTGEYLASGKAILATIFSDLSDHLRHGYNAMLAEIGDKFTYASNLERLIIDTKLREKLGSNAIKTAKENFNYNQGILTYIEEL